MGGDHKCPVCQATFTRPQHVARHMRSHTGDRPYKCQFCGDQFARSDLLSRHVNKCHANEKPLTPVTGNTRRKGSASASRATTSKQACDQCVQSSLPCDGCNPCAKCAQRKARCTYVKFHRQTAPVGPGHDPRPPSVESTSSSSSHPASKLSDFYPSPDDFLLGPTPAHSELPNPISEMLYANHSHSHLQDLHSQPQHQFSFSSVYGNSPDSSSQQQQAGSANALSDPDFAAKYRARADLFAKSTTLPGSSHVVGSATVYPRDGLQNSAVGGQQPWFDNWGNDHLAGSSRMSNAQSSAQEKEMQAALSKSYLGLTSEEYAGLNSPAYTGVPESRPRHVQGLRRRDSHELSSGASSGSLSVPPSATSSRVQLPISMDMSGQMSGHDLVQLQRHNGQPQSSIPSQHYQERNSENMAYNTTDVNQRSSVQSTEGGTGSSSPLPHQQHGQIEGSKQIGESGFSSAFGLMSLDDPRVMAGLQNDGTPFFSGIGSDVAMDSTNPNIGMGSNSQNNHHPGMGMQGILGLGRDDEDTNTTPMPGKPSVRVDGDKMVMNGTMGRESQSQQQHGHQQQGRMGQIPTPVSMMSPPAARSSKEEDTRELREFWKAYMRTPLSGPASNALDAIAPAGGSGGGGGGRRQRVSSLPTASTPPVLAASDTPRNYMQQQQQQQQHQHQQRGRMMTTTNHGASVEDLRSYEAAVLARQAPAVLNLGPKARARGKTTTANIRTPSSGGGGGGGVSQVWAQRHVPTPVSTTTSSSSLAGAFGKDGLGGIGKSAAGGGGGGGGSPHVSFNVPKIEDQDVAKGLLSLHSRQGGDRQSFSSRESSVSGDDGIMVQRPSVKRLPSQTLGPANPKRMAHDAEDAEDELEDAELWGSALGSSEESHGAPAIVAYPTSTREIIPRTVDALNGLAQRRRRRVSAAAASASTSAAPSATAEGLPEGESGRQDQQQS